MPPERSLSGLDPLTFPELRLLPDEPIPEDPEPDSRSDWLLLPLALRAESLTFELLDPRELDAPIEPPWLELLEPRVPVDPLWLEPLELLDPWEPDAPIDPPSFELPRLVSYPLWFDEPPVREPGLEPPEELPEELPDEPLMPLPWLPLPLLPLPLLPMFEP